jgi:hypothetical protein
LKKNICKIELIAYLCSPIAQQQAKIAQLVERNLAKVEVEGSNPFFRSKKAPFNWCFFNLKEKKYFFLKSKEVSISKENVAFLSTSYRCSSF